MPDIEEALYSNQYKPKPILSRFEKMENLNSINFLAPNDTFTAAESLTSNIFYNNTDLNSFNSVFSFTNNASLFDINADYVNLGYLKCNTQSSSHSSQQSDTNSLSSLPANLLSYYDNIIVHVPMGGSIPNLSSQREQVTYSEMESNDLYQRASLPANISKNINTRLSSSPHTEGEFLQ